jgi:superfamily I DNA/RNA helicase
MAVLSRTNAQLEALDAALVRADVPHVRLGAEHSPASDLAWPESPARWQSERVANAVVLSTIHRAKGLEWRHVAVVGFAEGYLPHYNATSPQELAEERRLAYVALTRAETSLLITWSKGRDDARRAPRAPSRFLQPIEAALAALTAEQAPLEGDAARARIAAIKADLESARGKVASIDGGPRRTPR